jgi:hypothetical protein
MSLTVGIFLLLTLFIIIGIVEAYLSNKKHRATLCRNGHKWHYKESEPGSGYFYLECEDCRRTFQEIVSDDK